MKASICFLTGREDPHLDWVLDGIATQAKPGDELELVVVDALLTTRSDPVIADRELAIIERTPQLVNFSTVSPHPNAWQGQHRLTSQNWWATASARNTALVHASYDYVAFLDDRGRLGPKWMQTLRDAERKRQSVIAGSYDKLEGPEDKRYVSHDHRRGLCPGGKVNCGGGWLYGCTFALPLEWALEINGFEEGCDGLTGEDYIFGLMLGNRGRQIDFVPDLFVHQDRSPGNESCKGTYACKDKGVSPNDKSHAALQRFGSAKRTEFTPDLRAIRNGDPRGRWPLPDPDMRDWYDGELIRDMKAG